MMRLFRLVMAALLTFGTLALVTPTAGAYEVLKNTCDSGATSTSGACSSQSKPEAISGKDGLLGRITKLVAEIAGIAAVIVIIISGIFFITADGDPAKQKGARNALLGAVIGIVIVLAAQSIITFVLSRIS